MQTALVTGGTGFIGHHLANALHKKGYKVTVIDIAYNNKNSLSKGINFIQQDIRHGDISGIYDYVYHLAAKTSSTDSFVHPQDYMSTNVWGSYNVLNQSSGSRVINISDVKAKDTDDIYGLTKKSAEHFINLHKNSISVRLVDVFGENQCDTRQLIPSLLHAIKYDQPVLMHKKGETLKDCTYVLDIVNSLIEFGEGSRSGVTEIGYGEPKKIINIYRHLCRLAKKKTKSELLTSNDNDKDTKSKYKISEPEYGYSEGLRRTVRWSLRCKEF